MSWRRQRRATRASAALLPLASLTLALALQPSRLEAQTAPATEPARDSAAEPAPVAPRRAGPGVHVSEQPGTSLVAVAVVIPVGSAADPEDGPGTARLLGEGLAEGVRWRIGPDAARLDVRVERGWTAFTLLSAPDVWERSWRVLEDALFRQPLTEAPVESARARLVDGFRFAEGAPVLEFERELYRVVAGTSDPWSRDPRGSAAAIRAASLDQLAAFRARHYQPTRATAGVVGPVGEDEGRAALAALGSDFPRTGENAGRMAWDEGDRLPVRRDVTNAWIGAAFPAPADLSRTALEFVVLQLETELNPNPPDPGVFSATAHIEDTPGGPVVVAQAAVMPEAAAAWERRILDVVDELDEEAEPAFFRWQRRRFRSATLLREGIPESAALRMALDLMREGRVRPLREEVWGLGPDELADAADELGEPRILIMGPDLSDP